MLSQTQQKIKILKSLFFGITYVLFFQANLIAQTTLGTISGTGSTGCSLTFNVNEGSIIRLTPTDEVGYSDFAWYYDQISQANIINSAAIAAGQFNIDSASVLPALLVKAPFGAAQSLRYILTSNVARTGCQAKPDTIHLNIIPIPPVANPDNAFAISGTQLNIPILINDLNPDGKPVVDLSKITKPGITLSPKKGTATINQNGSLSYTPDATATGRDTLIYEICNVFDITKCDTAVVIIDITPSNGPPVAIDDFKNTNEDTPVSGSVAGNDYDLTGNIDTLSFSIFKGPSKGSIVMGPNGSYTYIPAPDFSGKDTICYKVCDTGFPVFCDSAKLVINVEPVNDPPVAVYNTVNTPEDVPVTFSVLDNDYDIDGNINPSSVVVTVPPAHGTVSVDPITGVVTYIPAPNYNGPDVLIYRVCDDGTPLPALCDTAIVYINVTPVISVNFKNYVWLDSNQNGVQDANEPPIPGVGFELYSLSNPAQVIAVTSSDASGLYIFSSIAPGSYFIRTITSTFPQGAFITTPDLTTDNKDSDFNQASFTTGVITVAAVKSIANYNNLADLGLFLPRPSFKKFCGSVRVKILK